MSRTNFWNDSVLRYQVLNLDTNSDLWVAGGAGVTKITTQPSTIASSSIASTGTFTTATTGVNVTLASFTSTAVDHTAIQTALVAACPLGNDCCLNGTLNGGLAITRNLMSCNAGPTTDTIYVANTCNFGLVRCIHLAFTLPTRHMIVYFYPNVHKILITARQAITSHSTIRCISDIILW